MTSPDMTAAALKMAWTLLLLTGGLVLLLYLIRRMGGGRFGTAGGAVRLLSTGYVGVKKQVSLVAIPGAILVLGVTRDRITLLDKIDDPEIVDRFGQPPPPADGGRFAGYLAKFMASRPEDKSR